VPARYREELNTAAIGSAVKNYSHLLCDEEEVRNQKLNWHVLVLVWVVVLIIQLNCMQ